MIEEGDTTIDSMVSFNPNNWQLSALVLSSGIFPQQDIDNAAVFLNVVSRTIEYEGRIVDLRSKISTNYLALFAFVGEGGVPVGLAEQLDLEISKLTSDRFVSSQWRHCRSDFEVQIESRLNRVYVLKANLNQLLFSIGLEIKTLARTGNWHLVNRQSYSVQQLMIKTAEDSHYFELSELPILKSKISQREILIWQFCINRYQQYFTYKSLVIEITNDDAKAEWMTSADVSKLLNYFEKKVLRVSPYTLISDRKGHYCLVKKK